MMVSALIARFGLHARCVQRPHRGSRSHTGGSAPSAGDHVGMQQLGGVDECGSAVASPDKPRTSHVSLITRRRHRI
jgi:hypothetical protein